MQVGQTTSAGEGQRKRGLHRGEGSTGETAENGEGCLPAKNPLAPARGQSFSPQSTRTRSQTVMLFDGEDAGELLKECGPQAGGERRCDAAGEWRRRESAGGRGTAPPMPGEHCALQYASLYGAFHQALSEFNDAEVSRGRIARPASSGRMRHGPELAGSR
ncbi:unnamed protein product [Boreogadus saida]